MDTTFLITDFIIFTAAAVLGFIIGATYVESEFEKDSDYLAAEVENLNEALDALAESYEQLTAENVQLITALERSVDAYEKLKAEEEYKKSPEYLRKMIRNAKRIADSYEDN